MLQLRQTFRNRIRLGNGALLLIVALFFSILSSLGSSVPAAAASSSGSIPASILQSNTQANVSLEPTTEAFQNPWITVVVQQSGKNIFTDTVKAMVYVATNVYGVVYNTIYGTVYGLPTGITVPTTGTAVYGPEVNGAVYFDVYLSVPTPPPPPTPVPTPTPTPTTTTPTGTLSTSGVSIGTLSTGFGSVHGVGRPLTVATLTTSGVSSALAKLTGTEGLTVSIPGIALGTGQVAEVPLTSGVVQALLTAHRAVSVETGIGSILLTPAMLQQAAQSLAAGETINLEIRQTSAVTEDAINQNESLSQQGRYPIEGAMVDFALDATNSSGTTTEIEPTGSGEVQLTLPYNSSVSGFNADLLGVYRWDTTTNSWTYMGGQLNLATGTVTANVNHLSTYAVLEDTQTFSDIQGNYAQSAIEILTAHHVLDGVTPTTFDPSGSVTRAEFAAMLVRALGLPLGTSTNTGYKDVSSSDWFAGAVEAATKAGIVDGYPGDMFLPNQPISREAMAAMVVRAMSADGQAATITASQIPGLLSPYSDADQIASWAASDMAIAVQQNIISGVTATTLVPHGTATRAQAAVVVQRLLVYLGVL